MYAVRNWLYIGTHQDTLSGEWLQQHNIGAVLLLGTPLQQLTIAALHLQVHDGIAISAETLNVGLSFIHEQRNWGRRILLACDSGLSCAPAFAVAALKEKGCGSLIDAFRAVLAVHPHAQPHPVIWKSLCGYYPDEPSYDVLWFQINLLLQQHSQY